MARVPSVIAAVFLLYLSARVLLGGPRLEAAFEAGLIVGAALTLTYRPR